MRLFPPRLNSIPKMLDFYSQFNPSPLSIKQFIDFGEYMLCGCVVRFFYFNRRGAIRTSSFALYFFCSAFSYSICYSV